MASNKLFTVSTETSSGVLRLGETDLVTYSISRPVYSADFEARSLPAMNRASAAISAEFERYARTTMYDNARRDYINNNENGIPFHTYDATQVYGIPYNQDCRLSVYFDQYQYTGGAHGITPRTSQNWCCSMRRQLVLGDFFPHNPYYIQYVQCEVIRQISVQIEGGSMDYFENFAELVVQTFNPQSFCMTPDGLAVYFQQYDIAPYVTGIPSFILPYGPPGPVLPC